MAIEILHNVILIGCFVAVSFYNFISSTPSFLRKEKGAVVFNLNGTSKVLALWEFALFNIRCANHSTSPAVRKKYCSSLPKMGKCIKNYRPLSLLPIGRKLLEKLIVNSIFNFS